MSIYCGSCHCHSNLLETGAVDPNVVVDKYCPTPALVRACEDGRAEFAEALLKYGANVSSHHAACNSSSL